LTGGPPGFSAGYTVLLANSGALPVDWQIALTTDAHCRLPSGYPFPNSTGDAIRPSADDVGPAHSAWAGPFLCPPAALFIRPTPLHLLLVERHSRPPSSPAPQAPAPAPRRLPPRRSNLGMHGPLLSRIATRLLPVLELRLSPPLNLPVLAHNLSKLHAALGQHPHGRMRRTAFPPLRPSPEQRCPRLALLPAAPPARRFQLNANGPPAKPNELVWDPTPHAPQPGASSQSSRCPHTDRSQSKMRRQATIDRARRLIALWNRRASRRRAAREAGTESPACRERPYPAPRGIASTLGPGQFKSCNFPFK
jgi:hypothetical protein